MSPHPHPHPFGSGFLPSKINTTVANVKFAILLTMIMLYITSKFAVYFLNSVQYIPFNIRLNILRKKLCSSLDYFHLEMVTIHLLLILNSENFFIALVSVNDCNVLSMLFSMTSVAGQLPTFNSLFENIFKIVLFFNLFTCLYTPITLQWLAYIIKFSNLAIGLKSTIWIPFLLLILSNDIEVNPGPMARANNFDSGFLSFCNWNLNTLSKEDFYRITLLEAHNTVHNYDIISLCETSLNDSVQVPENALPGYKFHSCNHPDGDRNGGVGFFL